VAEWQNSNGCNFGFDLHICPGLIASTLCGATGLMPFSLEISVAGVTNGLCSNSASYVGEFTLTSTGASTDIWESEEKAMPCTGATAGSTAIWMLGKDLPGVTVFDPAATAATVSLCAYRTDSAIPVVIYYPSPVDWCSLPQPMVFNRRQSSYANWPSSISVTQAPC
jgi:hypothetical protein